VTYLSPLGYLLGVQGAALLRATREGWADEAFVQARIAEIRDLLDEPQLADARTADGAITTAEVYREWASTYDQPGNAMIDIEQPIVQRILDGLPVGTALDAACGTGRHAAYLAGLGHQVIGVDQSAEMLERAAKRLPNVDLRQANLDQLPLPDDCVDVIVCGLALTHAPHLDPVMAEFARVLRPGGAPRHLGRASAAVLPAPDAAPWAGRSAEHPDRVPPRTQRLPGGGSAVRIPGAALRGARTAAPCLHRPAGD
jgi:SAM-dependent methyltransferase